MKKTVPLLALMLFVLLSAMAIPADAQRRYTPYPRGPQYYRPLYCCPPYYHTPVVVKTTIFDVKPWQFRRAVKIFKYKYPAYKPGHWEYNFNGQFYVNDCWQTADDSLQLRLEMDGAIWVVRHLHNIDINIYKRIGRWN